MSRLKSLKGLIATFLVLSFVITLICMTSKSQTCKVTDFQPVNPVMKAYKAFTRDEACKKALTMCSYYSTDPNKCVVLK